MKLIVTETSYQAKFEELTRLQEAREELIIDKEEAKSQGDLKENAGYHMARDNQLMTETRIAELLKFLQENTFEKINPMSWVKHGQPSCVDVGVVVTIERPHPRTQKLVQETYLVGGALESNKPETATTEVDLLPHTSPLATAVQRKLVGGSSLASIAGRPQKLTVKALRYPTEAEIADLYPEIVAAKAQPTTISR